MWNRLIYFLNLFINSSGLYPIAIATTNTNITIAIKAKNNAIGIQIGERTYNQDQFIFPVIVLLFRYFLWQVVNYFQ